MHLVSYVDSRGQTVTVLRRTRAGALRLAQEITDRGGRPRVHRAELTRCEEVAATAGVLEPGQATHRLHSRVSHDPPNLDPSGMEIKLPDFSNPQDRA